MPRPPGDGHRLGGRNVRAKAILDRRIGPARARELAATGWLAQAQQILADSPYRHGVHVGQTLAEAEHVLPPRCCGICGCSPAGSLVRAPER